MTSFDEISIVECGARAVELLADVVRKNCSCTENCIYESGDISIYAEVFAFLVDIGIAEYAKLGNEQFIRFKE